MSSTVSVIFITTISYFWQRDCQGRHYSRGVTNDLDSRYRHQHLKIVAKMRVSPISPQFFVRAISKIPKLINQIHNCYHVHKRIRHFRHGLFSQKCQFLFGIFFHFFQLSLRITVSQHIFKHIL